MAMELSQVTEVLPLDRSVPLPEGGGLRLVHLPQGGTQVALDTLNTRPGDRVVVGGAGAAAALHGTNCPFDAVILAVLPERRELWTQENPSLGEKAGEKSQNS
jgi:hypothetical protein